LIAAQAVPFKIHAAEIVVIDVKDAISPPIASFITENIDRAASSGKLAIIIRLDTPGGWILPCAT
jgi:membrane-bound ClpP family serine protease